MKPLLVCISIELVLLLMNILRLSDVNACNMGFIVYTNVILWRNHFRFPHWICICLLQPTLFDGNMKWEHVWPYASEEPHSNLIMSQWAIHLFYCIPHHHDNSWMVSYSNIVFFKKITWYLVFRQIITSKHNISPFGIIIVTNFIYEAVLTHKEK